MQSEAWSKVQGELRSGMSDNAFKSWIAPLKLVDLDGEVAHLEVPTTFIGNYVSQNFGDRIVYEFNRAGHAVQRLSFRPGAARPAIRLDQPAAAPAAPAASGRDEGQLGLSINPDLTFDTFVVGKPNELANAASRRVAEGGEVTFNPLFLYGGVGLGKTHLMHAIANELQRGQPHLKVLYLTAEQFMYRFIAAMRDRTTMDFKQALRSVDVLLVDDVQFMAGKETTQEEFFHTFNALVESRKQIILSADRAPDEIKDMEDRIRSRMQCGLVVDIHPTDYELRLGVLQTKAQIQAEKFRTQPVTPGVLEYLAHRITTNVRVLEGALVRLFAYANLVKRDITLELAQDCLADVLKASDRKVSVEAIQQKVCEHYNIRISDLVGPKRLRAYARPRQVAMWLCKQLTSRSLPDIGNRFGKRDHTTVLHGVKRIEELRHKDSQIADDLELLRRALEA